MAAEVCLLLMQSLTGDCDTATIAPTALAPAVVAASPKEPIATSVNASAAVSHAETGAAPRFGELCSQAGLARLPVCAIPTLGRENLQAPRSMAVPTEGANAPAQPFTLADSLPTIAIPAVTQPASVSLPTTPQPMRIPTAQDPQFSPPSTIAANPAAAPGQLPSYTLRPSSGSELFRQRQLALQSGRSYTRLAPSAYADQWRTVNRQPTYEDWQRLLSQEARAVAGGQGQNRLEVIVGDSFGLWLPPDMLPRDRLWLNQSISGDTTAGILRRVSTFANTRATTIHLMAGANDLKNGVPEAQILSNLQRTVRILQQQHPQARIVVYSVLPTRRAEISNDRVRSLNAQIANMAQHRAVEYRDLQSQFQDEWGHLHPDLTTDGLHLNSQGYALWQQAMVANAW